MALQQATLTLDATRVMLTVETRGFLEGVLARVADEVSAILGPGCQVEVSLVAASVADVPPGFIVARPTAALASDASLSHERDTPDDCGHS